MIDSHIVNKILEKTLRDARKEGNLTIGTRQVLNSISDSKLIIMSRSVTSENIESVAKEQDIPLVHFNGTSVALGRMCGIQFRSSALSFKSISDSNIQSILSEIKGQQSK